MGESRGRWAAIAVTWHFWMAWRGEGGTVELVSGGGQAVHFAWREATISTATWPSDQSWPDLETSSFPAHASHVAGYYRATWRSGCGLVANYQSGSR